METYYIFFKEVEIGGEPIALFAPLVIFNYYHTPNKQIPIFHSSLSKYREYRYRFLQSKLHSTSSFDSLIVTPGTIT